ncbi:MAG: AAA family ATPase [Pseudomonadota bacterium]
MAGWEFSINNTIIYLTGFPASGKLTIAKRLCEVTGAILVDNHTINNPILQLVRKTGKDRISPEVWHETAKIREIVFDAMTKLVAVDTSFVLTNVLVNLSEDRELFELVRKIAARRKALFLPVKLVCEQNELIRRITNPDREEKLKLTDPARLTEIIEKYDHLELDDLNWLELDTTTQHPDDIIRRIQGRLEEMQI